MKKAKPGFLSKYLRSDFFLDEVDLIEKLSKEKTFERFKSTLYNIVEKDFEKDKDIYLSILAMVYHNMVDVKGITGQYPSKIATADELRKFARKLYLKANTLKPILIIGESGTSKGYIAKVLGYLTTRNKKSCIEINCAAIPEQLFESELFGHERGAFTGANKMKMGLIELADKGTFFLDELGKMPESQQAKLLKVIEEKEFYRIGGKKPIKVNVKFIAATQDVKDIIPDLRARFGFNILPMLPLRERLKSNPNIPSLLLPKIMENMGAIIDKDYYISKGANKKLLSFKYKLNYRDLEGILETAIENAYENDRKEILVADIPNEAIDDKDPPISEKTTKLQFNNIEDIKLKNIIQYADKIKRDIVEAKVKKILKDGKTIKSVLIAEGLPEGQYDGMFKKIRRITGRTRELSE